MDANAYLSGLRRALDSYGPFDAPNAARTLDEEYGVRENFPILTLAAGKDTVRRSLERKGYLHVPSAPLELRSWDGTVRVVLREGLSHPAFPYGALTGDAALATIATRSISPRDPEGMRAHLAFQAENYTGSITLQATSRQSPQRPLTLAQAVLDICEALERERIPYALPTSHGSAHRDEPSRIAYSGGAPEEKRKKASS